MTTDRIVILDFGSQYTQLIARRVREQNVYGEIHPCASDYEDYAGSDVAGYILSGGPASTYESDPPTCDPRLIDDGKPVLGICYGMQVGCEQLGGKVQASEAREYGGHTCRIQKKDELFYALPDEFTVWMSHGDRVDTVPETFQILASTDNTPNAAVRHRDKPFWGVQFHPEVTHTPEGAQILSNFLFEICGCSADWTPASYIDETTTRIRETVGDAHVVCGVSGGVDSSVTARLVHKAIGDQLTCLFVNNGLLRENEQQTVERAFRDHMNINLQVIDATDRFLSRLEGVTDPERKRTIIGNEFIDVFTEHVDLDRVQFLAQGTLYPDVIESMSAHGGPSDTIKSHHNVGGLPDELGLELIEPLRFLFKDEGRDIGDELGLPEEIVHRQPFPGPGLAVRVPGAITRERLRMVREADYIVTTELEKSGEWRDIWQYFAVLLPVRSVGVMGDERTYEHAVAVRAVDSIDGMTADWARVDPDVLQTISSRIINEVQGINRVVYDISTKPPSTIEWE